VTRRLGDHNHRSGPDLGQLIIAEADWFVEHHDDPFFIGRIFVLL
jgi:hypothetical protein